MADAYRQLLLQIRKKDPEEERREAAVAREKSYSPLAGTEGAPREPVVEP